MSMIPLHFKGGISNSIYEDLSRGKVGIVKDLQIFNTTKTLTPNIALVNDAGMPANFHPRNVYLASDGIYYFHGDEEIASVATIMIYSVSTLSTSSSYTSVSALGGSNSRYPIEEFKDSLYWGRSTDLKKYGNLSGTPAVSTSGATITSGVDFLKTHLGLGKLFYVHAAQQKIGYTSDGSAFTDAALTLEKNDRIVGIEPHGRFLLVGVIDVNNGKKAKILVWDGSSTTLDDIIYLGESGLQSFRVVNGNIVAIILGRTGLRIYKFTLGNSIGRPVANLDMVSTGVTSKIYDQAIETDGDVLYFGLASINDNLAVYSRSIGLFGFGNNTAGYSDALSIDRLISTGSVTANIICVKKFGNTLTAEVLVVIALTANSTFAINHTIGTTLGTVSANGAIESDAIPLKGGFPGKIKRITINHEAIPTSCGFTVQVKHYGHYPWGTSVPTVESYTDLTTPEGSGSSTGKTQSTNSACMTEIDGSHLFKTARYAQINIKFDEISTTNAPNIIYPVLVETED